MEPSTPTPRRGGAPSPSPSPSSYTPRSGASSSAHKPPTSRHRDRGPLLFNGNGNSSSSISAAQQATQQQQTSSSKGSGSGGVNVQVLLRCRPLSEEERRVGTPVVVACNDQRREVSVAQNIANKQIDRTFAFDKVFGPKSHQQDIFNHAVVPLVSEVLDGYNCTIFAYGQTGTGKTYTMEGGGGGKAQYEMSVMTFRERILALTDLLSWFTSILIASSFPGSPLKQQARCNMTI